jgi:hypothetical protein
MLTETQFKEIYARYQASGLSIRSFCMNEGINEAKFYYWKKRVQHILNGNSHFGFIPVKVDDVKQGLSPAGYLPANDIFSSVSGHTNVQCGFEITYPNGTRLKISGTTDYELIKSLLLLNR